MLNRIVNKTIFNPTLMPQFSQLGGGIQMMKPCLSQVINQLNINEFKPTALVTGSNRGLGLEITRQLLNNDYNVLAVCRNISNELFEDLYFDYPDKLSLLLSDSNKPEEIINLKNIINDLPIDYCILNAGILGQGKNGQGKSFGELNYNDLIETYSINTCHPILLAQELYNNVANSDKKQFIGITSATSSIKNSQNRNNELQWLPYRMSKTALNMAFQGIKNKSDKQKDNIHCMVLHPGTVKTKMSGQNAPLNIDESIQQLLNVVNNKEFYQNGGFYDFQGKQLPW